MKLYFRAFVCNSREIPLPAERTADHRDDSDWKV